MDEEVKAESVLLTFLLFLGKLEGRKRSRSYARFAGDGTDDEDDDTGVADDDNSRVVKILTKLLDTTKSEAASSKKELSEMTDTELEREQKEQNIRLTEQNVRLAKLKCDQISQNAKMNAALITNLDKIAKSAEIIASSFEQNRHLEHTYVFPDMGGNDRSTIAPSENPLN